MFPLSGGPERPTVVLGVGGGIAAYKACELLRRLREAGADVRPVPTAAALQFVGSATWAALSGHRVAADVWTDAHVVPHVALGRAADLVVVAPATADLLAKAACGIADDLLTNILLTARCPVVVAPAMHTEMWEHPATQANVAVLRSRGALVIPPAEGRLTGEDSGPGRLPAPEALARLCLHFLRRDPKRRDAAHDLTGRSVVVSAGGTREPIDPVRFLGNRSSGRQGYALAETAVARGATVTVVAANVELPDPAGARIVPVSTTAQLRDAVLAAATTADAVVMAAAVADFRPSEVSLGKVKKSGGGWDLRLIENPDVLAELGQRRSAGGSAPPGQVLVGFAAETGSALAGAAAKLSRKGCDLLVVNEVGEGRGFGVADNEAVILDVDGAQTKVPLGPKEALADVVWDLVARRWAHTRGGATPVASDP